MSWPWNFLRISNFKTFVCSLALAGDAGMGSGGGGGVLAVFAKFSFFFFWWSWEHFRITVTRLFAWIIILWIRPLKKKMNDKINLLVTKYNIQKLKILTYDYKFFRSHTTFNSMLIWFKVIAESFKRPVYVMYEQDRTKCRVYMLKATRSALFERE